MESGWAQAYVAIGAAVVSVIAAVVAIWQARSAKRQADAAHGEVAPTFHLRAFEDNGRPPWGFRLFVRNFNRKPLRLLRVRLSVPTDVIVWEEYDNSPDTVRKIIEAVVRKKPAEFDLSIYEASVLEGVS